MPAGSPSPVIGLCALCAAWLMPVEPPPAFESDPVEPVIAAPPLPVLRRLTNSSAGADRTWVRAVRDAAVERFDVDALPPRTPVDVWSVGDEIVAFRVTRSVDEGGVFAALRDTVDGEESWLTLTGGTLTSPLSSRPVAYRAISSNIGMREHPVRKKMKFHAGTDYAAAMGTPVVAIADGVVLRVKRSWTAGRFLVLKHDTGHETRYLHLDRKAKGIEDGVRVQKGQVLGLVGMTGRVTGPHLHFELRDARGTPLDAGRIRWPADGAVTDARALRALAARFAVLDGMHHEAPLELVDGTRAAADGLKHAAPSSHAPGQVPPVVPVRTDTVRARMTPPLPRRRRALPPGASLFDDLDEEQLDDPLVRRSLLLAAEFS